MTLEIHAPELEQRFRHQIQSGHFHDVDELLTRALDALERENRTSVSNVRKMRAEAVAHILQARKGNRLPEGVTIRDMTDKGRA
jgi:Arc/MetJ-type ribon-helix-helix transcriptional regulator